jgi:aerobic-type carbon monoxide dehydrogenase small subunit (CoxS/CutS family)
MDENESRPPGFSRRTFFKGLGTVAAATATASKLQAAVQQLGDLDDERKFGPGEVPVTLEINGKSHKVAVEPRVTLLDTLRMKLGLTGSKEVCDRATCGACTVLVDGTPTYSCMLLAIEAQGRKITTIEGLAKDGELTKVQKAFVECDALMCGFCTPGFVMSVTALLDKNPHPTEAEVLTACSGNLCRCGTYPRIHQAALAAAGVEKKPDITMITVDNA